MGGAVHFAQAFDEHACPNQGPRRARWVDVAVARTFWPHLRSRLPQGDGFLAFYCPVCRLVGAARKPTKAPAPGRRTK